MKRATIVLADDHEIVRDGLRALLNAEPDLQVVGEAADGQEAIRVVEQTQPDLLLLDIMMPGLNGVEVARNVAQRMPRTRVLVLSMYANEAYVLETLRNGAAGYVLKTAGADTLVEAIHTVLAGRRYLCEPFTEKAIEAYLNRASSTGLDLYETLSPREREVVQLAVEGLNNTQIGKRLSISPRTVEVHRANIMQKLRLNSYADLIRFAIQRGIIPSDH